MCSFFTKCIIDATLILRCNKFCQEVQCRGNNLPEATVREYKQEHCVPGRLSETAGWRECSTAVRL